MNAIRYWLAGLALLAGLLAPSAHAAEGRGNCTGYITSLPASITSQGTWCLDRSLQTWVTSGTGLYINASNVVLDCNHHGIQGWADLHSDNVGVASDAAVRNVTVRNCIIGGFGYGIRLTNGGGHLVEDNLLDSNLRVGMLVLGDGNLVRRNRVLRTGGAASDGNAIAIDAMADVIDNQVDDVFTTAQNVRAPIGILMRGPGTQAAGNQIRNLVNGGGEGTVGLLSNGKSQTFSDNHVANATTLQGWGIAGSGDGSPMCSGNHVSGFTTKLSCKTSSGDLAH